jgi:hypothetical protein
MLATILKDLAPYQATLIAVSKTKPKAAIEDLYAQGQRDFGENYVQELVEKQTLLPADIRWHFIGHLQSNKVKYIAPFTYMIHSVDSLKLLKEIDKQALKHERKIKVLLQFHIGEEATKTGLDADTEGGELAEILKNAKIWQGIEVVGVMGMASFTDNLTQVRQEFRQLKNIFDHLKQQYFSQNAEFQHISMGMSDDYQIALEEGSTMVRIGSLLFGKRKV